MELFYLLKGKYPDWSNSLIKIRNGEGDDWAKNLDSNKKDEFIKIVKTGSKPKYSNEIKKIFCKLSIKKIKSRFEEHFRENPDERGMAKKRIGWFLLSDQEKSEILNNIYH